MTATTQIFKIEILTQYGWTDNPSYLGFGSTESDNRWGSRDEALAACGELALVWGSSRCNLRVVTA